MNSEYTVNDSGTYPEEAFREMPATGIGYTGEIGADRSLQHTVLFHGESRNTSKGKVFWHGMRNRWEFSNGTPVDMSTMGDELTEP